MRVYEYLNSPLRTPFPLVFSFFSCLLVLPRPIRYGDSFAIGSHYEIAKLNYVKQCGFPYPSGCGWRSSKFVDLSPTDLTLLLESG